MQQTTNYLLNKPETNDYVKIEHLNENADIIDTELKSIRDVIGSGTAGNNILARLNSLENYVGNLANLETTAKNNLVAAINEVRQNLMNHINNQDLHVTQVEKDKIVNAYPRTGGDLDGRISQYVNAGTDNIWGNAHYIINNSNSSPESELPRIALHSSGAGVAKQIAGDHVRGGISVLNEDGDSLTDFNCENVKVAGDVYINGVGLFQSVSNGKSAIANAITGKGVATSAIAEFATMAANINAIQMVASGTTSFSSNGSQVFFSVRGLSFQPTKIMFSGTGSVYIWGGLQSNNVGWFHGVDNQRISGTSGIYTDGFTITMAYPSGSGTVTWYAWR